MKMLPFDDEYSIKLYIDGVFYGYGKYELIEQYLKELFTVAVSQFVSYNKEIGQ
jgi:hypothetical protein